MASGPEHYREAERLLEYGPGDELEPERVARDIAEAQVHATLALAAATALGAIGGMPLPEYQAWADVCGEPGEAATAAGGEQG